MAKDKTETVSSTVNKDSALAAVLANIEKEYGKGSIFNGSSSFPEIEFISTGCLGLDKALGGGFAKGRIAEIYGTESSGKTSIALHVAAEVQKSGGLVAFIDAEHALDPVYASKLGVDSNKLVVSQPDNAEQALNITDMLAQSGIIDLIIVDSVAALVPAAEIAGDIGDSHMGLQARIMGQSLRKLTGVVSKTNTTLIFINQLRMKIGVMFGNPETTSGGNALKFYASQRMDVRTSGKTKMGEEIIGQTTKVKIVKNKVSQPFKDVEFNIEHGRGINKYRDLISIAVEKNVIEKAGAWYTYAGERAGHGEDNVVEWLTANPDIFQKIYNECK